MDVKTFFIRAGNAINPLPKETLARVDALQAKVADFQSLRGPALEWYAEGRFKPELLKSAAREYMRFMVLAAVSDKPLLGPKGLAEMQRAQLTHSNFYWDDLCRDVLNRDVHNDHRTLKSEVEYRNTYKETLKLYRRIFGEEPPEDIWHRPKEHKATIKQGCKDGLMFSDLDFSHATSSSPVRVFPNKVPLTKGELKIKFARVMDKIRSGENNLATNAECSHLLYQSDGLTRELGLCYEYNHRGSIYSRLDPTFAEYVKYMVLASIADFPVTPSRVIREVSNVHKLFTRSYRDKLCGELLEQNVAHHGHYYETSGSTRIDPTDTPAKAYARTQRLYKEFFGVEPPERFWGENRHIEGSRYNENPLLDTAEDYAARARLVEEARQRRAQEPYYDYDDRPAQPPADQEPYSPPAEIVAQKFINEAGRPQVVGGTETDWTP